MKNLLGFYTNIINEMSYNLSDNKNKVNNMTYNHIKIIILLSI